MTAPVHATEAPKPPEPAPPVPAGGLTALEHYEAAYALAPHSVSVVFRLGSYYESRAQYVQALTLYLRHANRWGRVFEVRYRAAAILGMSDRWLVVVNRSSEEVLTDAIDVFVRRAEVLRPAPRMPFDGEEEPNAYRAAAAALRSRSPDLHRALLRAAHQEWHGLQRDFAWWRLAARFVDAYMPWRSDEHDAVYQRELLTFRNHRIHTQSVKGARLVTEVQLLAPWPAPFVLDDKRRDTAAALARRAGRLAGRPRLSGSARYAVACASSRLWEVTGDRDHATRSIHWLSRLVSEDSAGRWLPVIQHDPDLAAVRLTEEFQVWWSRATGGPRWDLLAWADQIVVDALMHALLLLRIDPERPAPEGSTSPVPTVDLWNQLRCLLRAVLVDGASFSPATTQPAPGTSTPAPTKTETKTEPPEADVDTPALVAESAAMTAATSERAPQEPGAAPRRYPEATTAASDAETDGSDETTSEPPASDQPAEDAGRPALPGADAGSPEVPAAPKDPSEALERVPPEPQPSSAAPDPTAELATAAARSSIRIGSPPATKAGAYDRLADEPVSFRRVLEQVDGGGNEAFRDRLGPALAYVLDTEPATLLDALKTWDELRSLLTKAKDVMAPPPPARDRPDEPSPDTFQD